MNNQQQARESFEVFEVFSQKNPGSGFVHQFSLLAPNHEVAMALARENFLRREPCYNIWVVRRSDIYAVPAEERPFLERIDNKNYRETKGYGDLQAKWRYHREQYEKQQASK